MTRGWVYGVIIGAACVGVWWTLGILAEAISRYREIVVFAIAGNLLVMVVAIGLYELRKRWGHD